MGTVRVKCLPQEHNAMSTGRVKNPDLLDPETNALTMGPLCPPHGYVLIKSSMKDFL